MRGRAAVAVFCSIVCFATLSHAETLLLRNGATISGEILKSTEEATFVDLGYNVLAVPTAQILEMQRDGVDPSGSIAAGTGMYETGTLKKVSVSDAAARYAAAVVLIRTPSGLGSGFFVGTDGYLLTNFHVIQGEKHISVTRFAREKSVLRRIVYRDVAIIATDPFHDLAVLKVEDEELIEKLEPVLFAASDEVVSGETVFVVGNPLGLERTVTKGVISQPARNFAGKLYLQIDAPVNAGNSGGPLFKESGEVIGVVNMKVPFMEGLNFAIPIRHAMFLLDHLDDYAYDATNPESGYFYPNPPRKSGSTAIESTAKDAASSPGDDAR